MGNKPGGNIQSGGVISSSSSSESTPPIPLRSRTPNSRRRSNSNSGGIPIEINVGDSDQNNAGIHIKNNTRRASAKSTSPKTGDNIEIDRCGIMVGTHHTPSASASPDPERGMGAAFAATRGHNHYQPLVPVPVPVSTYTGNNNPSADLREDSSEIGSTERFLRELSANSLESEEYNLRISDSPSDHPSQPYRQMQNDKDADLPGENSLVNTTVTATEMQIEQDISSAIRIDNHRPKDKQPPITSIHLENKRSDYRRQRSPTSNNPPSQQQPQPQRSSPTRRPNKNTNNELLRHLFRHEAILQNDPAISPALSRRLRDFSFAQQKRRETYGYRNPWGIIGLYDHLTGIRVDIEWAEDAAWRRENNEPYLSWKDFETSKDGGFNQPFFTYRIMFICAACLVLSIGVNGWKIESLKDNPMIGPSAQTLIDVGAQKTSLIVTDREWFRLLSPMFLHAGVIHYVLNMLGLWFVGYAVEMNHGAVNAAILFIVPAIGGCLNIAS